MSVILQVRGMASHKTFLDGEPVALCSLIARAPDHLGGGLGADALPRRVAS